MPHKLKMLTSKRRPHEQSCGTAWKQAWTGVKVRQQKAAAVCCKAQSPAALTDL